VEEGAVGAPGGAYTGFVTPGYLAVWALLFALVLACLAVVSWCATALLREPRARRRMRFLGAVVVVLLGFPISMAAMAHASEGTWRCTGCGERREETRYLGVTLVIGEAEPSGTGCADPEGDCRTDGHAWIPVGCHAHGLDTIGLNYPFV
jgi:hypothetical protein